MKKESKKLHFATVLTLAVILLFLVFTVLPDQKLNIVKTSHVRSQDFCDILGARVRPENSKNVFFVESGDSEGNVTLSIRQCCSIESAALINPHLNVFVLFTSQDRLHNLSKTPEVEAILSYNNVFLNSIDVDKFSIGTPFEEFFVQNVLEKSLYKIVHTSDVVRFMVLWKYGGTYLDTDIIVRQKLDSLPSNYACPESETHINNAAINFQNINENLIIEAFVDDLIRNFNGRSWGNNGPTMMTRVLRQLCNTTNTLEMVLKGNCKSFHVLSKKMCYPIGGMESSRLFSDSEATKTMKAVQDSLVVHFWNSATKNWKLWKTQKAAYIQLARQFCPKVMAIKGESF
jgi:lactosylceramide 4-alpha-galactosyltransferase